MGLKPLRVKVKPAAKTVNQTKPVIQLEGNLVTRYLEAEANLEAAKAAMEEIVPELKSEGLAEYFALAVANPDTVPSSVKLVDDGDATAMLTFVNTYNEADPEAVNSVFEGLRSDARDHAVQTVKAAFDSKVFLNKRSGQFDARIYNAFAEAIAEVAERFEVENPLSGKEVVGPNKTFHKNRFTEFPTVAAQAAIQAAMPAQVRLKPVVQMNGADDVNMGD